MTVQSIFTCTLTGGRTVKVWRSETGIRKEYDTHSISGRIVMLTGCRMHDLAKQIMELPGVHAVEVVDGTGSGILLQK